MYVGTFKTYKSMSWSTGTSNNHHLVQLRCSLCTAGSGLIVQFCTIGDYIKHLRLFHADRPDFRVMCGISGCLRSYNNLGSFKNYISFVHNTTNEFTVETLDNLEVDKHTINISSDHESLSEEDGLTSNEDASGYDIPPFDDDRDHDVQEVTFNVSNTDNMAIDLQKSSAHYLFGIKEKYRLTQDAIQGIIQGTASITLQCIAALKPKVAITYV